MEEVLLSQHHWGYIYKWSNHSLQLQGHRKLSHLCPAIESTATTTSVTHNQGREERQTGESSLSQASLTPGEAERPVIVQAPGLTLPFCSGLCLWLLTVSPCLLVPASALSTEMGCLAFSSLLPVAELVQPNLGLLQNQCSQCYWDTEPNTKLLDLFICSMAKTNSATSKIPLEFKANLKQRPEVIWLPFSFFLFSPQWKINSCLSGDLQS